MKKFLVVLLSLGLIVGFRATASAVDVSVSGHLQIEGAYENNMYQSGDDGQGAFGGKNSAAAIWTRTRIQPVFKVAEGLTLTVRIDALEKQWGNTQWRTGYDDYSNSRRMPGTSTTNKAKIQENIEFERSFVTFLTAIGQFDVGYQQVAKWGTGWGDYEQTGPRFKYATQLGPVTLLAIWDKSYESEMGNLDALSNKTDADVDSYYLAGVYKGGPVEAGLLYKFAVANPTRLLPANPYNTRLHAFLPYVKATFGPVYIESEFGYAFGKAKEYETETATAKNVDKKAWGGYGKAQMNLGPAYFGAAVGYSSGDDFQDATTSKNQFNAKNWNPALIMLGDDYLTDIFPGGNAYDAGNFSSWKNAPAGFLIYNIFGGFNPTPKLNVEMGFTMANFDVKPRVGNVATGAEYLSKEIGKEVDVTATYKIYDNLTYMIGAGYLWAGDAFKAATATASVGNDYILMNRLALTF